MNRLKDFALAVESAEGGFFPGRRSYRNNNPGNLKRSKWSIGSDKDGFCIFLDYSTGFKALVFDLEQKCKGNTVTKLGPKSTLLDFAAVYQQGAKPIEYATVIAKYMKLTVNHTLGAIVDTREFQTISVLAVNFDNKDPRLEKAKQSIQTWFNDQDVPTVVRITQETHSFVPTEVVRGTSGTDNTLRDFKVVSPTFVREQLRPFSEGQFAVLLYQTKELLTPVHASLVERGCVLVSIPVNLDSDHTYITEFVCHEILHGWYFKTHLHGIPIADDVHSHTLTDSRPEANYSNIVKKLKPYLVLVLQPAKDPPVIPPPLSPRWYQLLQFLLHIAGFSKGRM